MSGAPVTADVEEVYTLDVPALDKQIDGVILRIFQKARRDLVADARKNWRGWVYKGRPVSKRNISINAWESTLQTQEHPYSFAIENHARGIYGGKPYVSYIHRAGVEDKAVDVLFAGWGASQIPTLERELSAAILAELGKPGPTKRRRVNRASETRRLTLT